MTAATPTPISVRTASLWLAKEPAPYAGEWVALDGRLLAAHGPELAEVSVAAPWQAWTNLCWLSFRQPMSFPSTAGSECTAAASGLQEPSQGLHTRTPRPSKCRVFLVTTTRSISSAVTAINPSAIPTATPCN